MITGFNYFIAGVLVHSGFLALIQHQTFWMIIDFVLAALNFGLGYYVAKRFK